MYTPRMCCHLAIVFMDRCFFLIDFLTAKSNDMDRRRLILSKFLPRKISLIAQKNRFV